MNYRNRFKSELERFVADNIITPIQAERMLAATPPDRHMLGPVPVLIIFSAILFCAALFSFVAANWDEIPRLIRVVMIVVISWSSYLSAGILLLRGRDFLAQGAILIGIASFGGGLALVSQMYHLVGEEASFVMIWLIVSFVTALVMRSPMAVVATAILLATYLQISIDFDRSFHHDHFVWIVPLLFTLVIVLGFLFHSRIAIHLAVLTALYYLLRLPYHFDFKEALWLVAALGAVKFAGHLLWRQSIERLTSFSQIGLFYTAATVFMALLALQPSVYQDQIIMMMLVSVLVFGFIGLLLNFVRDFAAVRWLCYSVFTFELIYLYVETVGSLLSTAGFFLVLAVFILMMAGAIYHLEGRLKRQQAQLEGV